MTDTVYRLRQLGLRPGHVFFNGSDLNGVRQAFDSTFTDVGFTFQWFSIIKDGAGCAGFGW